MKKIKFTADTLMEIIKVIFLDEDVNKTIAGGNQEWTGRKTCDILNIHYYTFKHKILSVKEKLKSMKKQDVALNLGGLDILNQSYCLVSIEQQQRLFSKDIDQLTIEGNLEFWLQTEKVKLLENLVEEANLATCGIRIPVNINGNERTCIVYFDSINVSSADNTELGETTIVNLGVTILLYPSFASYSDWQVAFEINNGWVDLPVIRINFNNSMVPKSLPMANNTTRANTINLSNTTSLTIEYNADKTNEAAEMFIADSLSKGAINIENKAENNKIYKTRLIRNGQEYIYNMKIQNHNLQVNNSIDGETNVIVLSTGDE